MTATVAPTCKYCLPMGSQILTSEICDRHTLLFDHIDPIVVGDLLPNRLREAHRDNKAITLDVTATDPRMAGGGVMGTVIGHYEQPVQLGPRHRWTVRDLNGALWVGESNKRGKVRFVPRFDTDQ